MDIRDVPGYDPDLHVRLMRTIATPNQISPLIKMLCHYSPSGKNLLCAGWLANQLHNGNIMLRLARAKGKIPDFELIGEQRARLQPPDDALDVLVPNLLQEIEAEDQGE